MFVIFQDHRACQNSLLLCTVEFSVQLVWACWLLGDFWINTCSEWLPWCEGQQGEEMLTCFLWEQRSGPDLERSLLKWTKSSDHGINMKITARTYISGSGVCMERSGVVEVRTVEGWQTTLTSSPAYVLPTGPSSLNIKSYISPLWPELWTCACYLDDSAP